MAAALLVAAGAAGASPPGGFGCGPYHDLDPPFRKAGRATGRSPIRTWKSARFDRPFESLCRCYGTLGNPRAECEARYLAEMEHECAAAYGDSAWDKRALARCRMIAELYHRRAVAEGGPAWRDAQDEARILDSGSRPGNRRQRSLKWKLGYPELIETEPPRVPSSAR